MRFLILTLLLFNGFSFAYAEQVYCISKPIENIELNKRPSTNFNVLMMKYGVYKADHKETLPTLYFKPITYLRHSLILIFLNYAYPAVVSYSPTLKRAFVTGYLPSFFGISEPVSYEIVDGKAKLLPQELQGAELLGPRIESSLGHETVDVPIRKPFTHFKGVLFKGKFGDLYFYDGVKVLRILDGYKDTPKQFSEVSFRKMEYGHNYADVKFLFNAQRILISTTKINKSRVARLENIYEVMPDGSLELRPELLASIIQANNFNSIFELPKSNRLFSLTQKSVVVWDEPKKQFRDILILKISLQNKHTLRGE